MYKRQTVRSVAEAVSHLALKTSPDSRIILLPLISSNEEPAGTGTAFKK